MNRKFFSAVLIFSLTCSVFSGCKGKSSAENISEVEISLKGGSGRTRVLSPCKVFYRNKQLFVQIVFNSSNFDYVIADGKKYLNEEKSGNSTFTVPVNNLADDFVLVADTTAMSVPHEIKYTVSFGDMVGSSGMLDEKFNGPVEKKPLPLCKTGDVPVLHSRLLKIEKYDDFRLVDIAGSGRFLVVPENEKVPEKLPEDVVVLKKPLDRTYLVSTSAMDFVARLGAMDMLKFCGLKEGDWFVPEAREAMKKGGLVYAGKYNIPDFELLYGGGCCLAVENTMVLHTPQAKEKLEELGIPVLIERSTYEKDPLGRLEWIKLYGTLFDRELQAEAFFEAQKKKVAGILKGSSLGKSVCFFYVTTSGAINVRKSNDYVAEMISLAGGSYVPAGLKEDGSATSTMNLQMESFYAACRDADILIYNGTILGGVESSGDLLRKDRLFGDFKALKNGNAYYVEKRLFQETCGLADFILDLNKVMLGEQDGLVYLKRFK